MGHESNIALEVINTSAGDRIKYVRNIRVGEIKCALGRMKVGKDLGPYNISIEI